jgi:hypothetical protein
VATAKAEVDRLERQGAAAKEDAVLRKLFEVASSKGADVWRRRLAALWLLTIHYGTSHRERNPLVDRFAAQRTADSLAQRYWAEAGGHWPTTPPLVTRSRTDPLRPPGSPEEIDRTLERTGRYLETWGADGKDLSLINQYRLADLDFDIEESARRLHLDVHGQADLEDRLYDLALKLAPETGWRRQAVQRRALTRQALLEPEASTKLLASIRPLTTAASAIEGLALRIEENGYLARLLAATPPSSPLREYLLLDVNERRYLIGRKKGGEELVAELATPLGAYKLTGARRLSAGDFLLVGEVPAWVLDSRSLSSGPRRDRRRADELRYHGESAVSKAPDVVMVDGSPRRDLEVRLELDFRAPDDFWPRPPARGETLASRKLTAGRPRVAVLVRTSDIDRDPDIDPLTHKLVWQPMKALAVLIGPDVVQLVTAEIERGSSMSSKEPRWTVLAEKPAITSGAVTVTVRTRYPFGVTRR